MTTTSATPIPTIWPGFVYQDARAAIDFLTGTFGFEARIVVANEDDPRIIEHSQLNWPEGGTVMVSTADRPGNVFSARPIGGASVYVVTDRIDELAKAAANANCPFIQELQDNQGYEGRGFSIRDPEGNIWSFGTYRGE
jgi:uncharacterized glyoxalase superfamily protein PhnB